MLQCVFDVPTYTFNLFHKEQLAYLDTYIVGVSKFLPKGIRFSETACLPYILNCIEFGCLFPYNTSEESQCNVLPLLFATTLYVFNPCF